MKIRLRQAAEAALVAVLALPAAWADVPPARVGTLEYVEGSASIDGRAVAGNQSQLPVLDNGQLLGTASGHAEMLLTPGVFLRLDKSTKARLENASLTDTRLRLEQGAAMLEVDNLHKDNLIRVDVGPGTVQVLKNGLYRFEAVPAQVLVLNGQVEASGNDQIWKAGKHHEISFSPGPTVAKYQSLPDDDLSKWSRLRSEYEAEASVASAQYFVDSGWGWGYPYWYWNPWFDTWTWFPANGWLMNPYGFGYFSPMAVYSYFPMRYYGPHAYGFAPRVALGAHGFWHGPAASPAFRGGGFATRPAFGHMGSFGRGMRR